MDRDALRADWTNAWRALGVASIEDAPLDAASHTSLCTSFEALVAAYSEPQRAYHTLQHLGECLSALQRERAAAERPAEIALALWFHDAIYEVRGEHASENEARSADWAVRVLTDAGVAAPVAHRVHALIMATKHDVPAEGADAELLIDIDLSILGASVERFAEYERQIRIEYAHIAPEVFEPRRRAILGSFLARDPIYLTPSMRARHDAAARRNLQAAIG